MEEVRKRWEAIGREGWESIEEGVVIREGSIKDYERLAQYHYRGGRPGTVRRVWVAETGEGPVGGGSENPGLPPWAVAGARGLVGVVVVSMPVLRCRLRDEVTGGRYARIRDVRERAQVINAEVRCISRVVVDPRWRGLGIAVRLVKNALASAETVYTEAVAAMGAVHPFFEKAGMTGYQRPAHEFDLRMRAVLEKVRIDLEALRGAEELAARLGELEEGRRKWVEGEMGRWWGKRFHRRERGERREEFTTENTESTEKEEFYLRKWLEAARGAMGGEPGYWIWRRES